MSGNLAGRRVLVPRGGAWGVRVSALVEERGASAVIAPIIETRPPNDHDALVGFITALGAGRYSWLFITSSASVDVLRDHRVVVPASTSIAAVGESTRDALENAGYSVAFVPAGPSSSQALVDQWNLGHREVPAQNVLVMRSDLASATVSDELALAGHSVDVCIAYRTVGIDLTTGMHRELMADSFDAVLVTSRSVAMELARQLRVLPSATLFACLGPATAAEAARLGLSPLVTAAEQSVGGLLDAIEAFYLPSSSNGVSDVTT
jgi:uroporphyrinogen-III synthase